MTSPSFFTSLLDLLIGHHTLVRRYSGLTLATAQFYVISIGVTYHAASAGLVPWPVAHGLAATMVLVFSLFYALVRSGWSLRCSDPVLTMQHVLLSQLIVVAAYVLIGPTRSNIVVLMGQGIAVSMFRLKPRQTLMLGLWSVGWLSLAQLWLVLSGAPGFSGARALGHFLVSSSGLMALALVAMWISAIRVRISSQAEELRATLTQAQSLATIDVLTGLLNRRCMIERLEDELTHNRRAGRPLSVALIDIDHFKRLNDVYGHRSGDEVLREFAARAQAELRQVDHLARWGGEEFLLLMPAVDEAQAWTAVDRLRQRVAAHPMGESGALNVTLSAGVAQWQRGESMENWLERADKAMYAAKQDGRNRCLMAGSVDAPTPVPPPTPSLAEAGSP